MCSIGSEDWKAVQMGWVMGINKYMNHIHGCPPFPWIWHFAMFNEATRFYTEEGKRHKTKLLTCSTTTAWVHYIYVDGDIVESHGILRV